MCSPNPESKVAGCGGEAPESGCSATSFCLQMSVWELRHPQYSGRLDAHALGPEPLSPASLQLCQPGKALQVGKEDFFLSFFFQK